MILIRKKYLWLILKLVWLITLIIIVSYTFDFDKISISFTKISKIYVIGYIILVLLGKLIYAYRLKIICNLNKIKQFEGILYFFRVNVLGESVNIVFPTSLSGETVRIIKIKGNESAVCAAKSIIWDRLIGLISMVIVAILFSPALGISTYKIFFIDNNLIIVLLLFVIISFCLFLLIKKNKYRGKLFKLFDLGFDKLFFLFFLSFVGHLVFSFGYYLLLIPISYLSYIHISSILFVSQLAKIIPVSIVGIGLSEASFVLLGQFMGVEKSNLFIVVAIALVTTYLYSIIVFVMELLIDGNNIILAMKNGGNS